MKASFFFNDERYQCESDMGVFSEVVYGCLKDRAQQVRVSLSVKVTLATYCNLASILMQ